MIPSLGFSEILVLAVLALVVVGPKDLPLMLRKLGRLMAKLRAMANEFRSGFDELARQAELDELKREVEALRRTNPLREIEREVTRSLPSDAEFRAPVAKVEPAKPAPPEPGPPEPGPPEPDPAAQMLPPDPPSSPPLDPTPVEPPPGTAPLRAGGGGGA